MSQRWFVKRYGKHLGPMIYRTLIGIGYLVFWFVFLLFAVRFAFAAQEPPEKMSWLVVVYLPITQEPIPYVRFHRVEKSLCNKTAKQIFNNVKAGKARAFCL